MSEAANEWDEYADGWDADPAARAYAEAAFDSLTATLATRGSSLVDARVLDFGCGTGLLTERLSGVGARVVALDLSSKMLAQLDAKVADGGWTHVRTLVGSHPEATALGETFDLVVCSSVCAFVPDYPGTVAALAALLRPGGLFVQWDWELDPDADEPYGLTRDGIRSALERAGLVDVGVETAFERPIGDMVMRPLMGVGRRSGDASSSTF
ncbi:MAG: class I SAM-dependent DNA methyltransferase [Sandaracinaceae bacterium]